MTLRTSEAYLASLRDSRRVFVAGERVEDVTTHPVLSIPARHAATLFGLRQEPELATLFSMEESGRGRLSRYFQIPRSGEDLLTRGRLIEETTRRCHSTLNIIQAVGTDALLGLRIVAPQMDRALGTRYAERVEAYHRRCADEDLSLALAQTDVKGDRSLRPHEQSDPDLYVRIAARRPDGIVVRGAKAHLTMGAVANEIIVLPTRAMGPEDRDYAVAFAVPANAPGLTMICRPTVAATASAFDHPISRRHLETESLTTFEDVFVPAERVFLCGEWQFAGPVAAAFATFHRFTGVSYKPPLGDLLIGAAQLVAEYNGLDGASHVREKIAALIQYTETIRACGKAAAVDARVVEGVAVPDPVMTNVGKYHFASQFHQAVALLQDLAGGLAITAPSGKDLANPETRPLIEKYLVGKKGITAERRLRLFHLIRDLTASDFGGYNLVVSLHGEGSLAAQRIATYRDYDLDRCKRLVLAALEAPE